MIFEKNYLPQFRDADGDGYVGFRRKNRQQ